MDKKVVLARILEDLDWLYNWAEDNGERSAVSFVEDVVAGWYNAEALRETDNG